MARLTVRLICQLVNFVLVRLGTAVERFNVHFSRRTTVFRLSCTPLVAKGEYRTNRKRKTVSNDVPLWNALIPKKI